MNELAGAFFLLFGLSVLVFRARISRRAIEDWARAFPRVRVRKSIYDVSAIVGGIGFVAVGVMMLLGIIRPR